MRRRAANRKSAQLSRARKKAHLEDLKTENLRLQRLHDVLDSQPQLVFCFTASGKVTFVSERTLTFVQLQPASSSSSSSAQQLQPAPSAAATAPLPELVSPFLSASIDRERERAKSSSSRRVAEREEVDEEEPLHLPQLLCPESADAVLRGVQQLLSAAHAQQSQRMDLSALFFCLDVFFLDSLGHRVSGAMRCSQIQHRQSIDDEEDKDGSAAPASALPPAAKRARKSDADGESPSQDCVSGGSSGKMDDARPATGSSSSSSHSLVALQKTERAFGDMANIHLLADCVSSLASKTSGAVPRAVPLTASEESARIADSAAAAEEEEFVCVVHMRNLHFAPFVLPGAAPPVVDAARPNAAISHSSSRSDSSRGSTSASASACVSVASTGSQAKLRLFLSTPVLSVSYIEEHNAIDRERGDLPSSLCASNSNSSGAGSESSSS